MFKNNNLQIGKIDVKVMPFITLAHIDVSGLLKNYNYDVFFLFGDKGSGGMQKAYIITNNFGALNDTIRFTPNNTKINIKKFYDISCVVFISKNNESEDIVGFREKKFDYESIFYHTNNEYAKNKEFDRIIDFQSEYQPFLSKVKNLRFVKINSEIFNKIKLKNTKESLEKFIVNSLKIYGFLIFGRYICAEKVIYILGIPDQFNPSQRFAMTKMGICKFYGSEINKCPKSGDSGFWAIYL
jgi:hypothetical protein